METKGKILFLATLDMTVQFFLIPHMKLLRDMGYEVEVAANNIGFSDKIKNEGFKVYDLPFSRNPLNPSNLKATMRLYKIMKENKYIMLHTHTPVAGFFGRVVGRIAGIPHIIYTAHGFHFHEYGSKLRNLIYFGLEKFAGKFTDLLITINTDDYKVAVEKNIAPKGKVLYVKGVGVDTERFNPENVSVIETASNLSNLSGPIFASVGRLETEKHIDHLLKAFSFVKQAANSFKLLIIGDGPKGDYLKKLSSVLNIQDNVEFLGYVREIERFLKISNVFVFASSREGLPVSVMEAMAMEKPIIAYNVRGVRDLVEDGVNGFLVPFGDVKAFAERVVYLMEHPEIAEEMGKRGREKIVKEFSLHSVLKDMRKLYRNIGL